MSGEEITVRVAAVDEQGTRNANVHLDVTAVLKSDKDLQSGDVYINLIYAGSVAGDEGIESAVSTAMDNAMVLYEDQGIRFSVETKTTNPRAICETRHRRTRSIWKALSGDSRMRTINVVVVPSVLSPSLLQARLGAYPGL